MAIITPEIRIVVYRPRTSAPIVVNKGPNGIKSLSSTRAISGEGSATIEFNDPKKIAYTATQNGMEGYEGLRSIFTLNTIISIQVKRKPKDNWRQINLVYVDSISFNLMASGGFGMTVTLPTLEKKFRDAELFIDYQPNNRRQNNGSPQQSSQNTARRPTQRQTIEQSLVAIGNILREFKTVPTTINAIWDGLIVDLMQVKLISDPDQGVSGRYEFGGRYFIGKTTETDNDAILRPEIMTFGITTALIQVFQITSQVNLGESLNFWQMLSSMLTEPFYELFLDPLETVRNDRGFIESNKSYRVYQGNAKFVFRLTPFVQMFGSFGEWNKNTPVGFHEIELEDIKSFSLNIENNEIYSGVHVGLTILDMANQLIVPVKWNNVIRALTGTPRVLQVKLSGIGFEPEATEAQRTQYADSLRNLRDRLYSIFFNVSNMKVGKGSISTSMDFYRVGKPFKLKKPLVKDEVAMPSIGYIVNVTDQFGADGTASSTIQYKWASVNIIDGVFEELGEATGGSGSR